MKFEVERKNIKNSYVKVSPDKKIKLVVPSDATENYVSGFFERKKDWIERQILFFEDNCVQQHEKQYVSGESIRYLGKNYRLKVFHTGENYVKYYQGYIFVYCGISASVEQKKKLVNTWLKERALEKISTISEKFCKLLKVNPDISFREMKTRWGSCSFSSNKIIFNWKLVEKNSAGIEYVVMHELIHLKLPFHDKNFYKQLRVHMPDWEIRQKKLYEKD